MLMPVCVRNAHITHTHRACACARVCPTNPLIRTCISLCLINSLTPMADSRLSFSSQKVTKHSASTRPWLLSCWLCYWDEFIFNNFAADTWFGTFPLQRCELHFLSSTTGLLLLCRTVLHKLEIVSQWKINVCTMNCVLLTLFSHNVLFPSNLF